jgi:hypothetical protein
MSKPLDKHADKLVDKFGRILTVDDNLCLQEKTLLFQSASDQRFVFRGVLSALWREEGGSTNHVRDFASLVCLGNVVNALDLNPELVRSFKNASYSNGWNDRSNNTHGIDARSFSVTDSLLAAPCSRGSTQ